MADRGDFEYNNWDDFCWVVSHMAELYDKHGECHVAVRNGELLGVYKTFNEAVSKTAKEVPIGTFFVKKVTKPTTE